MRRTRVALRCHAILLTFAAAAAACGSRTGLFADDGEALATATPGAVADGGRDTGADVALPTIDATTRADVVRDDCPDAAATLVYVVTSENDIHAFYPPDRSFRLIGHLACPAGAATPFSMAVDRKGVAYVLYSDGALYAVSTATAACKTTSFAKNQLGFETFGMGFALDAVGGGDTLYVADADFQTSQSRLGVIDTTTFELRDLGAFVPSIPRAELTGTGDGRLFAFWPDLTPTGGAHLVEIDAHLARVVAKNDLAIGSPDDAFAFAFWGGDFWIFTSSGGSSDVNQFSPTTAKTTLAATFTGTIVGAGVSTCAPLP